MRVLRLADVVAHPEPMVRWAAQALLPGRGGAAWAHGAAVGVRAPALNRHDRLVVAGPVEDVAAIVRAHHHGLSVLTTTEGAGPLTRLAGVSESGTFGWMEQTGALPEPEGVDWLHDDDAVADVLRVANPHSYVWPGGPGPRRWAGVHVNGTLAAVGADAWSAPGVGFLAGVATHPDHRGRGLSTRLCGFLASTLLDEHGACALMVDAKNTAAITVYRRLGFTYRSVTALREPGHKPVFDCRDSVAAGRAS